MLKAFFLFKKKCGSFFDCKKHVFAPKNWKSLYDAIHSNNHKLFWSLVSHTYSQPSHISPFLISPSTWTTYYSKIFSALNSDVNYFSCPPDLPEWSPVLPSEIKELISSLKSGKAPGPDGIPTEFLTNNPSWWSTPLSNLFTIINKSGLIPATWLASIIVPIFKKGDPASPNNHRSISLLSFIGKLYSRYILNKLTSWADSIGLPGREQIGFQPGASTMDHVFTLSFLASKYSEHHGTKLYLAFIDLRGAFDSTDRNILWRKLIKWGIDPSPI